MKIAADVLAAYLLLKGKVIGGVQCCLDLGLTFFLRRTMKNRTKTTAKSCTRVPEWSCPTEVKIVTVWVKTQVSINESVLPKFCSHFGGKASPWYRNSVCYDEMKDWHSVVATPGGILTLG